MKPKNTLTTVGRLMRDLRPVSGGQFKLIAVNKHLQLTNKKDLPPTSTQIQVLSSGEVTYGLTSRQWNNLDDKIQTLIHEGVLK